MHAEAFPRRGDDDDLLMPVLMALALHAGLVALMILAGWWQPLPKTVSVTGPVVESSDKSVNSSLPGCAFSDPSLSTSLTLAAWLPPARLNCPLSIARRSWKTSPADWVKFTYTGSICCTTANAVASPWPTKAPSVTSARPMRPEMGEVTLA